MEPLRVVCVHISSPRFRCAQGLRLIEVMCQAELAAGAGADLREFVAASAPLAGTPEAGMGLHAEATKKLGPRLLAPLTDLLAAVGQAHLLRRRIATELLNLSRRDLGLDGRTCAAPARYPQSKTCWRPCSSDYIPSLSPDPKPVLSRDTRHTSTERCPHSLRCRLASIAMVSRNS